MNTPWKSKMDIYKNSLPNGKLFFFVSHAVLDNVNHRKKQKGEARQNENGASLYFEYFEN